jgi:Zn-dependent membrane protease YugP
MGTMEWIFFMIVPLLFGFWAQHHVTSSFRTWSEVPSASGMTGSEVARRILDQNGLHDVQVVPVAGELSDHYDPKTRTVALSEPVFGARSVSALSVAAHEVGHAIQHQQRYAPMSMRAALFPAAALGSNVWQILLMVGMVLMFVTPVLGMWAIAIGVGFYAFAVLFHVVTLPVEFDASRRAKVQLQQLGVVAANETNGVSKVLSAAAMTYVAGALAAIMQLIYWVMILLNNRN